MCRQCISAVLFCLIFCFSANAQSSSEESIYLLRSTISNDGGSVKAVNSQYLVQYSIEQSSVIGLTSTDQYLARQGFIQPVQIATVLSKNNDFRLLVDVYPNPAIDEIFISFNEMVMGPVDICLYDRSGRLVMRQETQSEATLVYSIENLAIGNYFLTINAMGKQYVTQISKH